MVLSRVRRRDNGSAGNGRSKMSRAMPVHSTFPPQDAARRPAGGGVRERLARLMDALARGASPPGMIDIVQTRQSHLQRRITMIARYDGKAGRWSAAGVMLSVLIG